MRKTLLILDKDDKPVMLIDHINAKLKDIHDKPVTLEYIIKRRVSSYDPQTEFFYYNIYIIPFMIFKTNICI